MNPNDILKLAKDALEKALAERRRNDDLLRSIGPAIVEALTPALNRIAKTAENSYETKAFDDNRRNRDLIGMVAPAVADSVKPLLTKIEDLTEKNADILKNAVKGLKVEVNPEFKMPEIKVPDVIVPEIKVPPLVWPKLNIPTPIVNFDTSKIRMPEVRMPDEMNVKGWVGFQGYDRAMLNNPLPVQLRDADGNPVKLFENLTSLVTQSSGGGGGFPMAAFVQSDQSIRVSGSFSVTASNASSQIIDSSGDPVGTAANPLNVAITSGAASSTKAQIGNSDGDYSNANPLPVLVTGSSETTIAGVLSGDNRVKVELPTGSSGLTDTELRASSVPVAQASGAVWSTSVIGTVTVDGSGVTQPVSATNLDIRDLANATDSVSVYQVSGASWSTEVTNTVTVSSTNLDIRDLVNASDSVSAYQVSGANYSVNVTNPVDNGDAATALRVVVAGNSAASVSATQVGTWNIGTVTTVTGVTNSVAASLVDSSGVQYSGSNPVPVSDAGSSLTVDGTVTVSDVTASVKAALVDSTGVQYSGSNPLPTYLASGGLNSVIVTGPTNDGGTDDGSNPLKVGGIARTTNPTAHSNGQSSALTLDDLGRQLTRPIQVRDLIATAYATLNTNSETTLRAGVASTYLDLIHIMGTNLSTNAVYVDVYTGAAGAVMQTIGIPAGGTAGLAGQVPIPATEVAQAWYVKLNTTAHSDVSNTTVLLSALFSQEV